MQISDEAIEAGAKAYRKVYGTWANPDHVAKIILEAAAPILLSHERQQTADAHRDAIVNRDAVDRLERELQTAKADAWDDAYWIGREDEQATRTHGLIRTNPYRSQS
jgi:dihydropteroate synthase